MKKIAFILIIILLSGCYNYNELNNVYIVSSISIDKKDNNYLVCAQVMNEKKNKNNTIVYEEEGKTIYEALRRITQKSPKILNSGHLGKIVISEEIAKEGIINVIDLFQRLPEIKDEFTITIAKNIEANKVIKIVTNSNDIPAETVTDTIKNADFNSGLTYNTKLDEFVSNYLKEGIDPVISVIAVKNYNKKSDTNSNIKETKQKTSIETDSIGITYNSKLERYLNKDEMLGYSFLMNKIDKAIIPIKCGKNYSSIKINKSKTKKRIIKNKNNYKIIYNINVIGSISENNCRNNLKKEKEIKIIENKVKNKINKNIEKVINVQNKVKSRFLGFERMIYINYPKDNNYKYSIKKNINVSLENKGEIINSSKGEKYE